jgi:membrane associated rhomboid family serine protease
MIPIRDSSRNRPLPLVVWSIIIINTFIFLWSRQFQLFGPPVVFGDLGVEPLEISMVFSQDKEGNLFELGKIYTSMFLHANIWHLFVNMLFLQAFGPTIERALGGWRFVIYYLFWGIIATGAHIFVNTSSAQPLMGASGAIGGVLGCYLLLYPSNKIEFIVLPVVFWTFKVRAFILLGIWFLWQILFPQENVANWAHAGGFMAGMLTVQLMGGSEKVLEATEKRLKEYDAAS